MTLKLAIATALLIFTSSCAGKEYIYYKSKCACKELPNYADIKKV